METVAAFVDLFSNWPDDLPRRGVLVPPGQADVWAREVGKLLDDSERLAACARLGRDDFVEKYAAENEQEKLDRFLSILIGEDPK